MGSILTDCMSSVEQIRQQAAGSLVEPHAHFCHRGEQEEGSHPSLLFVKALSHRDRLMTALLNLWLVFLLKYRTRFVSGRDFIFLIAEKLPNAKWVKKHGGHGGPEVLGVLLSCSAGLFSSAFAGARRGKGNRRFMSSCDTHCSGSHVNGKWDV